MADEIEIPQYLMDEHMDWHRPPSTKGSRNPPLGEKGAGLDFLVFHRQFIRKVVTWYNEQNEELPDWPVWGPGIPQVLKYPSAGWSATLADAEVDIVNNPLSFATADELGGFIEDTVHGFLHKASAICFDDDNVGDFKTAPMSLYFYSIHRLIEYWWLRWIQATTPPVPWYPCVRFNAEVLNAQQTIEVIQEDMVGATSAQKADLNAQLNIAQANLARALEELQRCLRYGEAPPSINVVMGDAMNGLTTFTSALRKNKLFAEQLMSAMKNCDGHSVRVLCQSIGIANVHFEPYDKVALIVPPLRHIALVLQGHMLAFPVDAPAPGGAVAQQPKTSNEKPIRRK